MKTILELQEELERVMPKDFSIDIVDYNPSEGGNLFIKEYSPMDEYIHRTFSIQTLPEALETAIEWFKNNYKP